MNNAASPSSSSWHTPSPPLLPSPSAPTTSASVLADLVAKAKLNHELGNLKKICDKETVKYSYSAGKGSSLVNFTPHTPTPRQFRSFVLSPSGLTTQILHMSSNKYNAKTKEPEVMMMLIKHLKKTYPNSFNLNESTREYKKLPTRLDPKQTLAVMADAGLTQTQLEKIN